MHSFHRHLIAKASCQKRGMGGKNLLIIPNYMMHKQKHMECSCYRGVNMKITSSVQMWDSCVLCMWMLSYCSGPVFAKSNDIALSPSMCCLLLDTPSCGINRVGICYKDWKHNFDVQTAADDNNQTTVGEGHYDTTNTTAHQYVGTSSTQCFWKDGWRIYFQAKLD